MNQALGKHDWIINEINTVNLGDKRLNKRLGNVLEMLSRRPQESITVKSNNWAEVKAAYRFFDNNAVTMDNILGAHYDATFERIKSEKVVLLPQDTTELDYSSKKKTTGIGKLHYENHKGVFLHPVIAITPERICLGIVDAKMFIREELGKSQQYKLPIEQKESIRWLEGYQVAQEIALKAPDTTIVSIADRECDIYEVMEEAAMNTQNCNAEWIIRSSKDRCLDGSKDKLRKKLKDSEVLGTVEFDIPSTHKRKARHVAQEVKAITVTLKQPYRRPNMEEIYQIYTSDNVQANSVFLENDILKFFDGNNIYTADITKLNKHQKGRFKKIELKTGTLISTDIVVAIFDAPCFKTVALPPVKINAVLATEINPPADVSPIAWILLTSLPIDIPTKCIQVIEWYLCRWQIEVFFKVLKAGCVVEELQLQTLERLSACIALYMIISWRILYMTMLGRSCPDMPCNIVFAEDEWRAAYIITYRKKPPEEIPTLNDMIIMVAGFGGFLKRKCDGFPGSESFWIGLQRVRDFAIGIEIQNELK